MNSFVTAGVILIGFAAQAFVQWRLNTGKASVDAVDNYKKVVESYKERIEQQTANIVELQRQVNNLTETIGHLRGTLDERDRQLKQVTEVLSARDPAAIQLAIDAKIAMVQIKDIYQKIVDGEASKITIDKIKP